MKSASSPERKPFAVWLQEKVEHHRHLFTDEDARQAQLALEAILARSATASAVDALRELVACKDMHDRIENRGNGITAKEAKALNREYRQRRPLAWQRARDVLAGDTPPEEKRKNGWIAVGETLPSNTDHVLVAYLPAMRAPEGRPKKRHWSITICRYSGGAWRFVIPSQKSRLSKRVKFWQPIPDAPEAPSSPRGEHT